MRWVPILLLTACHGAYDGPAPEGEGVVYGRILSLLGTGLGDVEICGHELDVGCVMSESDGDFLLEGLPTDTDVIITMSKDGHLATAYHHNTSLDQEWRKTLMSDSIVNSMTNRVDTEQEPGKGHAMFILWSGPDYDEFDRVPGVTFSVDPADGVIYYQANGGMPDPELTETSNFGSGGSFNMEPGDYRMRFEGKVCEQWFSHDFEAGGEVPITILPDFGSYVDLVCR